MDRLLVALTPSRPTDRGWSAHDVALAASPGRARNTLERFGPVLLGWPRWTVNVPLPAPGIWVGEFDDLTGTFAAWREPTVYELEAVTRGAEPWSAKPALFAIPGGATGNVSSKPDDRSPA